MDTIRLEDTGVKIDPVMVDPDGNVINISAASAITFHFQKPDGSVLSVTGALDTDGTDGKVKYVTQAGNIDQVGTWQYQVYVTLADGPLHSEKAKFKVQDIIVH